MSKIYPQNIKGKYRSIKDYSMLILITLYFVGSWIRWDRGDEISNQALFIDLPNRHAYFFGIEISPEEIYYVTGILIIAAFALFFVTSFIGRLWCGYTCPHTVFTDLFIKVEQFFQGDRNQRIKLDNTSGNWLKISKKLATHISWLAIGFLFAFGWVCYFYDAFQLFHDLLYFKVSYSAALWLIGLTFSTYLFAGFVRQRVCMHMCPYGRFQSAMVEDYTKVVTYNSNRGEPRKGSNDLKQGACIDCYKCVVVCPMGIDIRDGFQMECIGCGLCIDACNSVMKKLGEPLDLIGYSSAQPDQKKSFLKLKYIIFLGVLLITSSIMVYSLLNKATYQISIIKEHGPLYTITPDGSIRNTYLLKISNKSSQPKHMIFTITGLKDIKFIIQNNTQYTDKFELKLSPHQEVEYKVFVKIPPENVHFKQQEINFVLQDTKTHETITKHNSFVANQ